jgi:hypothetical protein
MCRIEAMASSWARPPLVGAWSFDTGLVSDARARSFPVRGVRRGPGPPELDEVRGPAVLDKRTHESPATHYRVPSTPRRVNRISSNFRGR